MMKRRLISLLLILLLVFTLSSCVTTGTVTPKPDSESQVSIIKDNLPGFIIAALPGAFAVGTKKIIEANPNAKPALQNVAICLEKALADNKLTYSDVFVIFQLFDYWKKYYGQEIEMIMSFIPIMNKPAKVSSADLRILKKIASAIKKASI